MTEERIPFRHSSSSLGKHTGDAMFHNTQYMTESSFLGCEDDSFKVRNDFLCLDEEWT